MRSSPQWAPFLFWLTCLAFLVTACEIPLIQGQTAAPTPVLPAATPAIVRLAPAATSVPVQLPTAVPTRPLEPTPTFDPGLADWTFMVYMDADNNLELSGLLDINEMEAAGEAAGVNVLVQIDRAVGESDLDGDWTEARRFKIQADGDTGAIGSEPVTRLGEVNMGDPAVLADFVTWGITNYPANRFALIIWDHGAGWNGIAFDSDAEGTDGSDHISLADMSQALNDSLARSGLDRLDVVAFDACLMGQLDVFQALQPYAEYAVGSEELTPGTGWDYEMVVRHLYQDPTMDGSKLAGTLVKDFIDFHTVTDPDDFVTMSAVDLAALPAVSHGVEVLATTLLAEPDTLAIAAGDARSGAETYARIYAREVERYAAIDLRHFAEILARRSPDKRVMDAATALTSAIDRAVIAHESGAGLRHSAGIAVYFPRSSRFYTPEYEQVTQLRSWNQFLKEYHQVAATTLPPPDVRIVNVLRRQISVQAPAYLDLEVAGRNIDNVALIGGRFDADGRRRLLEYDHLIPEPQRLPGGGNEVAWRDGVHDDFFVWDTEVTYLFDGEGNGDFVVMWPTEPGTGIFSVEGRYRRAGSNDYFDAHLAFDQRNQKMTRVWGFQSDQSQAPAEIRPMTGDEFQLYSLYLSDDNAFEREPGPRLFFDDQRQLYFEWRALPEGDYFLGFAAENSGGVSTAAFTDVQITNTDLVNGYRAYLDPYLGFQFLYPGTWYAPVYSDTLLYTSNVSETTRMQLTLYPNLNRRVTADVLKQETLNRFGPVDVLYEEEIVVAGMRALRTSYGYDRAGDGPRTGIFLSLVQEDLGLVVDVDGSQTDETATIAAVATMVDSWAFLQAGFGLQPGDWAVVDLDAFTVARPADFIYQEVNGWQKFSANRDTFVALRTEPASRETLAVLEALVRDAGADVTDFTAGTPFPTALGSTIWDRVDFAYTSSAGEPIWGFLMVRLERGQEIVAWAEAPANVYNELEPSIFLVMVADLSLGEAAASGE